MRILLLKTALLGAITALIIAAQPGHAATQKIDIELSNLTELPGSFAALGVNPTDTGLLSIYYDDTLPPYMISSVDDPLASGSYSRAFYRLQTMSLTIGGFSHSFASSDPADSIVVQDATVLGTDAYSDTFAARVSSSDPIAPGLKAKNLSASFMSGRTDIFSGINIPMAEQINNITLSRDFTFNFTDDNNRRYRIGASELRVRDRAPISTVPLPAGLPLILTGLFGLWGLGRKRRSMMTS